MYPDGGLEIGSFACTERDDSCRNRADGNNAFPIWAMRAFLRGFPWLHANVLNVAFDHIFHTHFSVAINGIHFRIFLFLVAFRFFGFSVFHLWFDLKFQKANGQSDQAKRVLLEDCGTWPGYYWCLILWCCSCSLSFLSTRLGYKFTLDASDFVPRFVWKILRPHLELLKVKQRQLSAYYQ